MPGTGRRYTEYQCVGRPPYCDLCAGRQRSRCAGGPAVIFARAGSSAPQDGGPDLGSPSQVAGTAQREVSDEYRNRNVLSRSCMVCWIRFTGEFTFCLRGTPGPVIIQNDQPPRIIEIQSSIPSVSVPIPATPRKPSGSPRRQTHPLHRRRRRGPRRRESAFGEERLLGTFKTRNASEPTDTILDAMMKSLENWACHVNLRDDLSLVAIEAT